MEFNNSHNVGNAGAPNPNLEGSGPIGAAFPFSMEFVAPVLADLKRQLELREAMH